MARRAPSAQMVLFDELPKAGRPATGPAPLPPAGQVAASPPVVEPLFPADETVLPLADAAVDPPARLPPGCDPVFFAVLTGGKVAGEIVAAGLAQKERHRIAAPLRPANDLHIAVLGAGKADDLSDDDIGLLMAAGDAVSMPGFAVRFSEALSLARTAGPNPLVLPCGEGADAMTSLAEALWAGMRDRGVALRSTRMPVHHLTLAYDPALVPRTPLNSPINLAVHEFALVRSFRGEGRYETLKKWALAG